LSVIAKAKAKASLASIASLFLVFKAYPAYLTSQVDMRAVVLLYSALALLALAGAFQINLTSAKHQTRGRFNAIVAKSSSETVDSSPSETPIYLQISEKVFETDKRPVILFDGICNLCNSAVNFVLDTDPVGEFRFAALQSQIGRALLQKVGRNADDISTIVLVTEDTAYIKSEAVMQIARKLQDPYPAIYYSGLPVPNFVRNILYNYVSENRYQWLGERDECRLFDDNFDDRFIPEPEDWEERPWDKQPEK